MLEFKYDTQLLIEGENLSEDEINEYITKNIEGDCLLAVGDEELIKIHFHTNVHDYCNGEVLHVPTLDLSKWVYDCEVKQFVQTGDSDTFFCDIKNVQIDKDIDISEGIDLTLFDPVVYSGDYHSIGSHLGKIGDYI